MGRIIDRFFDKNREEKNEMLSRLKALITAVLTLSGAAAVYAGTVVVPPGAVGPGADVAYVYFGASPQTIVSRIDESQLGELSGQIITGFQLRLDGPLGAAPAADLTFTNYDVFLGVGSLTQVRSGVLNVPAGAFPSSGAVLNPFGPVISITPFMYTGGDLLFKISHGGNGIESIPIDFFDTGFADTAFSASYGANIIPASDIDNGVTAIQFVTVAVPEPATVSLIAVALSGFAVVRRRSQARKRRPSLCPSCRHGERAEHSH